MKQLQIVWHDRSMPGLSLGLVKPSSEEKSSDESLVDEASGAAVGVGCPGGYCARNVPIGYAGSRGLAVAVLTAPSERDGAVRDTERRAGEALQTTTAEEGLSLRQAVERCGSGALTVGRCLGYANSLTTRQAAAADECPTHAPPGHSNSD